MKSIYSKLQWLPRPLHDIADRLKKVKQPEEASGGTFQALASFSLDVNQLTRLGNSISRAIREAKSLEPLKPFRLAILSNGTPDIMAPTMVASAARHGIALDLVQPPFDQIAQQALSRDSLINRSRPDAVLLALDYRALPLSHALGDAERSSTAVQTALDYIGNLATGIKTHSAAICIVQTIVPPPEQLFGSFDRAVAGTMRNMISEVNRGLTEFVAATGHILLDVASMAENVGLTDWHDVGSWQLGKFPFSVEFVPLYADCVARTIAAMRGRSRKVLILDLDNTVWGGVIGDDGLEGIRVAQGDACGEAHLALQRYALELRERGVILAVSSKNDDVVARAPFRQHPEMLLKLEHIAVFQANWQDKATNIKAIASELSLGLDACVFVDDNPVERGLVRQLLPQVAVPELPENPAWYVRTVAAAGYFEAITFSQEDRSRAAYYQDNAKRVALKQAAGGVDSYLASLDMTIHFQPFDAIGRARIVQLVNKSNQFNLTTRRYTDAQIEQLQQDPQVFTLQVRLTDSFGDNGMICVVICRLIDSATWEIDTWLMSCRVLGRRVESAVLEEVIRHARSAGIQRLLGSYVPSGRNQMVAEHYAGLGFEKVGQQDESTWWEFPLQKATSQNLPLQVVSQGFFAPQLQESDHGDRVCN